MNESTLNIGRHEVTLEEAAEIIGAYTAELPSDRRPRRDDFYSWPHYDRLETGSGSNKLNDGDLLAPVLLNVNPGIHGFATLQGMRSHLEQGLREIRPDERLDTEADAAGLIDRTANLFAVLDMEPTLGVRGITLSKVLHRKRPTAIPLCDRHVYDAYTPGPVAPARQRSWEEYIRELMEAMRDDLCSNTAGWTALVNQPSLDGLTTLRALDMVAWWKGKHRA